MSPVKQWPGHIENQGQITHFDLIIVDNEKTFQGFQERERSCLSFKIFSLDPDKVLEADESGQDDELEVTTAV